jgi:hypothetical protein
MMEANVVVNILADALISLNPNCQEMQEYNMLPMLHSSLNQMVSAIHYVTTIVAFLDEGSNLMANTFCHTSSIKTNPFMQYVIGIDFAPIYCTIIHIV